MPRSEAQKKADRKYFAANYKTLGFKVRKEYAEVFKELCVSEGKTVNAKLTEMVMQYVKDNVGTIDSYIEE